MWSRGSKWEPVEVGEWQANKAVLNRTIHWSGFAWQPAFRVLSWIIHKPSQPKGCTSIPHHLPHRWVFLWLSFRTTFLLLSTDFFITANHPTSQLLHLSTPVSDHGTFVISCFSPTYSKCTASPLHPPSPLTSVTLSPLPADTPCCSSPVPLTLLCFHLLLTSASAQTLPVSALMAPLCPGVISSHA